MLNVRKASVVVLLLAGLTTVSACAGLVEEVTPEQRALEVVVLGDGSRSDACSLNYDEVGAATHSVAVIAEHGTAHVRILDDTGTVVFEADSTTGTEGPADEISESRGPGGGDVRLVPGDYQV